MRSEINRVLLALLVILSLGCADNPTTPTLTEEEIGVLVDALGYLEMPEKG